MKNSRKDEDNSIEWKPVGEWGDMLPPSYEKTRQLVQSIWKGQATVESVDSLLQDGAEIEEDVFFYKIGSDGERIRLGGNALIAAAMRGDANMVRHLLSLGADPNSKTRLDYYTPLSAAAGSKDMETLRLLLEAGAKTTRNGASPLVEAAKVGWQEGVQCLLESGADANEEGLWKTDPSSPEEEVLPLICAVHSGNIAVVDQLLDAGAQLDPEEDESMDSALTQAVRDGNREMVTHLLERGASLEESHTWWNPPLAEAIKCQDAAMVRLLLESGASVEKYFTEPFADFRTTPLCVAAMNEAEEVVRTLIAAGAQVNDPTPRHTPLEIAASEGDVNMVRLLHELGADVNAPLPEDFPPGYTVLMGAATSGVPEVVKLLLDAGADVNAHLKDRFNALEMAPSYGHLGIARLLIEAGAEPRPADTEYSPLRAAARAQHFHPELLRLLLTYYPDVRTAPHVHNALVGSVDDRLTDATEILLAAGADPNAVGESYYDGEGLITPLMAAISNDSLPVIRRLLAAGADPNKAVNGKNALDYALSDNPKPCVVRLLRIAGAH